VYLLCIRWVLGFAQRYFLKLSFSYIVFTYLIHLSMFNLSVFKTFIAQTVYTLCKVKQFRYRPGVAKRFQEVKVPRFHDNGTGWW